jgi:histidyl-tRNA synthetase
LHEALTAAAALDVWVVVADEERRADALRLLQDLRGRGLRADLVLAAAKVGRQFQAAEAAGARTAVVVGAEWPVLKVKHLAQREEVTTDRDGVWATLGQWMEIG